MPLEASVCEVIDRCIHRGSSQFRDLRVRGSLDAEAYNAQPIDSENRSGSLGPGIFVGAATPLQSPAGAGGPPLGIRLRDGTDCALQWSQAVRRSADLVRWGGVGTLRHLSSWQLLVLLLATVAAGAQDKDSIPTGQTPAQPETLSPGLTVTGSTPSAEPPLPKLPPDQFTDCYSTHNNSGDSIDYIAMTLCEAQLAADKRLVLQKCFNRDGKNLPPVVIQACTETLDHEIFIGSDRFYVYVNRAEAYGLAGDRQHALEDYNQAVKLAPHNAKLYFNRGVFYLAQPDVDAAKRDFDTALSLNPKLVPALLQRAKIHRTQEDFSGALADYSEAIRLEPKTAAVWSDRGYVCLIQHHYESAIDDEGEAIRLDPKLARAYFFRGAALKELGDSAKARADLVTALRLDPSLARYITSANSNPTGSSPP